MRKWLVITFFCSLVGALLPAIAHLPMPTPSIPPAVQNWCELCQFELLRGWEKIPNVQDVSCAFRLDGNGEISDIRINKSNSPEVDESAISLLQNMPPLKRTLWSRTSSQHKMLVDFDKYPTLRFFDRGLEAWPQPTQAPPSPTTLSDRELLNFAFDFVMYPIEMTESGWKSVTCGFTLEKDGRPSNIRVLNSSNTPRIDTKALDAIGSSHPPFKSLLAPLQQSHEIVVEFFSTGDFRAKVQEQAGQIPIGRAADYPPPSRYVSHDCRSVF